MICVAQLPSIIEGNYVIRKADTPLKFNKTYIDKDAVLTVEAGAVLEGNKLEVDGELILLGSEKDSIKIKIGHLLSGHKIVAKYCVFNQTKLDIRGFEKGFGEFKNCIFRNSEFDNRCKTLTCEDNLFENTNVANRNGMATYKDNFLNHSPFSVKDFGSAMIEHNQFRNISSRTIDIDRGSVAGAIITIRNNHFELDSLFKKNHNDCIAIRAEFAYASERTVLIENNVIKNYNKAFTLELDYNGAYVIEKSHFVVIKNQVEGCDILLSINPEIGCRLGDFVLKNNRFSNFKTAFIDVGSHSKADKKAFLPYIINKNKYDIPLSELLKRIDDFTGDYEKWIQFQVENY